MLKYKRVYETTSAVQYEYYPEGDTDNKGLVSVSKKTGEVGIVDLAPKDELKIYANKLIKRLRLFHNSNEYKETGMIAWY